MERSQNNSFESSVPGFIGIVLVVFVCIECINLMYYESKPFVIPQRLKPVKSRKKKKTYFSLPLTFFFSLNNFFWIFLHEQILSTLYAGDTAVSR